MQDLQSHLINIADENFRDFSSKLIPTCDKILGIKVPELRKIAREIYLDDWKSHLDNYECEYLEEVMIKGMIIGMIKEDLNIVLNYIREFIPLIDNWATCDIFCGGLKIADRNRKVFWDFIQEYLQSDEEYFVRFGVVMIQSHFICDDYIGISLNALDSVSHEGYYSKMAVAWAVSTCYIKYPDKTLKYLKQNNLDDETYNKAIQKIIESRRVCNSDKDHLRKMKRR